MQLLLKNKTALIAGGSEEKYCYCQTATNNMHIPIIVLENFMCGQICCDMFNAISYSVTTTAKNGMFEHPFEQTCPAYNYVNSSPIDLSFSCDNNQFDLFDML